MAVFCGHVFKNCLAQDEKIVEQLKHLRGFCSYDSMKILEIQSMSEHMDATHCSQVAERTGSLKILLYLCLPSPFGRLNASCCEISTMMARLFDLALIVILRV